MCSKTTGMYEFLLIHCSVSVIVIINLQEVIIVLGGLPVAFFVMGI